MSSTALGCLLKALPKQELLFVALVLQERMQSSSQGGDSSGQNYRRHYARARPYRPPLNSSYSSFRSPIASSYYFPQSQFHTFRHPYHRYQAWSQPLHCQYAFRHPYDNRSHWNNSHLRQRHDGVVSNPHSSRHRNILPPSRPKVHVSEQRTNSDRVKYPLMSLVSYNLLAQDLIHKNMFLYRNDRMEYLEWDHRKKQLLKEVLETHADMYCFQEVQEDHYYDWYYPELKAKGYEGVFQKRTGHYTDGCALFYLSHKLQILEHKKVLFQKQKGTLIRDNVALIAKFALSPFHYPAAAENRFCVATTHLLFNHKAGEIKLAQVCYLMAELHRMASDGDSILPSIICGDFNCLPHSPLLDFLLNSKLDYSKLDAWDICGYKNKPANYRQIPVPVVPQILGIGQNCLYRGPDVAHSFSKATGEVPIETASTSQAVKKSCSSVKTSDSECIDESNTAVSNTKDQTRTNQDCASGNGTRPSSGQSNNSGRLHPRPIITHPFNLQSGYPIPRDKEHSPTVTTYHRSACETVDYIFFTPSVVGDCSVRQAAGFHLVSRTALPSQHTLRQYGPQPNHAFSSDHLYLQIDLQLIN